MAKYSPSQEISETLRLWREPVKKLYLNGDANLFAVLHRTVLDLVKLKDQLQNGCKSTHRQKQLLNNTAALIDWANKKLKLDLVPRRDGSIVDCSNISIVELYNIHKESEQRSNCRTAVLPLRSSAPNQTLSTLWTNVTPDKKHVFIRLTDIQLPHFSSDSTLQLNFNLFDASQQKYLHEQFVVKRFIPNRKLCEIDAECLLEQAALFMNLDRNDPKNELYKDLYLVVRIFRVGPMLCNSGQTSDKSSKANSLKKGSSTQNAMFRRPFACAVQGLSSLITGLTPSNYHSQALRMYKCCDSDFYNLPMLIIRNQMTKAQLITDAAVIATIRTVESVGCNEVNIRGITIRNKVDLLQENDEHCLRITVESAEIEKGSRGSPKSVEVTAQLIGPQGEVIKGAVDDSDYFCSYVQYHSNTVTWNESLTVRLPSGANNNHLRFLVRHCAAKDKCERKLLSFGVLPLMRGRDVAIPDKYYALVLYKCEDSSKLKNTERYIGLGWNQGAGDNLGELGDIQNIPVQENHHFTSTKDVLIVKVTLHSPVLTSNEKIANFINWRLSPDFFLKNLENLETVSVEDILKCFTTVMNALCSTLMTENGQSTPNSLVVFRTIVFILCRVPDLNLHRYVLKYSLPPLLYRCILEQMLIVVESSQDHLSPKRDLLFVQNTAESFQKLSFLASNSFRNRKDDNDVTIVEEVLSWWSRLCSECAKLIILNDKLLVPIQNHVLFHLCESVQHWITVFSASQISHLLSLLAPIFYTALPASLEKSSLIFATKLCSCDLLKTSECCTAVLSGIVAVLVRHLPRWDSLGDLRPLLTSVVHIPFNIPAMLPLVANGLIEHMVGVIIATDSHSQQMGELISYMFEILRNMKSENYTQLKTSLCQAGGKKRLKDFFFRILLVLRDLVKADCTQGEGCIFPGRWFAMHTNICRVMLGCMRELSMMISAEFSCPPSFDPQLWTAFFTLCSHYVTQPCLTLHHMQIQGSDDMRVMMGYLFINMWNMLGENQCSVMPGVVGPLLQISVVPQDDLRKSAIPLLYDLFEIDFTGHGSLTMMKCELFDKLDVLETDSTYRCFFSGILREKIANICPEWAEEGRALVGKVSCLLEKLLDYREVVNSLDTGLDKHMFCVIGLLEFYRDETRRDEMYMRYIYKLHDLLVKSNYCVEAADTLKLYADLLKWRETTELPADQLFSAQPEWQRKKALYERAIEYYDKAKCWERGIGLCKELVQFYESHLHNYQALAICLNRIAQFYENIVKTGEQRERPQYFRVAFIGTGFPAFVVNKTLVYRGDSFEKLSSFSHRLGREWPDGIMLNSSVNVDDTLAVANKQYLQISSVTPICSHDHVFTDKPEFIKKYYEHNEVTKFEYNRPIGNKRNSGGGESESQRLNDFQTLWTERTTLTTECSLPNILPWATVINESVERISPVQNACITIKQKNEELKRIVGQYSANLCSQENTKKNVKEKENNASSQQPLLMVLKGTIEAAVNGGISMYQKAFFTPQTSNNSGSNSSNEILWSDYNLQELQTRLWEQMQLMEKGLEVSERLVSEECRPLHDYLCKCFLKLKREMKRSLDSPHLQRHSTGSLPFKMSVPSTPESAVMSLDLIRSPKLVNLRPQSGGMSSSWDATMLLHSEDEDNHVNGREDDLLAPLCRSAGPRTRERRGLRPKSTHLEDLISRSSNSSMSAPQTNLSDSNIAGHLSSSSRSSSPSRLRRFITKLGVGNQEGRIRSGRSPRNSDDSGIERHLTSRSRSPRWPRKLGTGFASFSVGKHRDPPYKQLEISRETTPDTLIPPNPPNPTPPRTQSLEIHSLKSRLHNLPRSSSRSSSRLKPKEISKVHDCSKLSIK